MILVAFRHGVRASELVDLRWDQIDFNAANMAIRRVKQGSPSIPSWATNCAPCADYSASRSPSLRSCSHPSAARRSPGRALAGLWLGFKAHPHMLRHACGFALANAGHDTRALQAYLGHKNIQHTVRYTELSPERFRDFWKD